MRHRFLRDTKSSLWTPVLLAFHLTHWFPIFITMDIKEKYRGKIENKQKGISSQVTVFIAVGFKHLSPAGSLPCRLQWWAALFAHTDCTLEAGKGTGSFNYMGYTNAANWSLRQQDCSPLTMRRPADKLACLLLPCLAIKGVKGKPVVSLFPCRNSCRNYPRVQVSAQKIFPGKATTPPGLNW